MNKTPNKYIEVQSDAEEVLKMFKIYEPPVPTAIITKVFKTATIDVNSFFEDEVLGFVYPNSGNWHILINENLPLGAQRFTVFHELYHMLKSEPGFCRQTPEGELRESKANVFAANILMPARWFRKEWEKSFDVEIMARKFFVSPSAVRVRLKNLEHYLKA